MRIKVFEESLPLESIYETIKNSLKSQYIISNKSHIFENIFLIIARDSKNYVFVIRGSTNNSKNRIILSIVAADINTLLKLLNLKNNLKLIENRLYDLIVNNSKEKVLNPFKIIPIEGLANSNHKKKNLIVERNVLNQILQILYEKFNYNDDLITFPFSIFNIDGTWEFWVKIYGSYLKEIESTIVKNYNGSFKTYKYYDFALPKEIFPRIFDLIVIENSEEIKDSTSLIENKDQIIKNKESEKRTEAENNLKKSTKWIGFIYVYKKLNPMTLIDLLKLSEEVINYVNVFKKKSFNKDTEIKPFIIFLSLYGYEDRIGKYLREHLHHDYKHFIPILIVPTSNNEIWHNFDAKKDLSQEEEVAKNRAKQYLNLYNKDSKIHTHIQHNIEDARENYSEILNKEKEVKDNFDFIAKWSKILNTKKSNELLTIMDNKNKFKEAINKIKILSE